MPPVGGSDAPSFRIEPKRRAAARVIMTIGSAATSSYYKNSVASERYFLCYVHVKKHVMRRNTEVIRNSPQPGTVRKRNGK